MPKKQRSQVKGSRRSKGEMARTSGRGVYKTPCPKYGKNSSTKPARRVNSERKILAAAYNSNKNIRSRGIARRQGRGPGVENGGLLPKAKEKRAQGNTQARRKVRLEEKSREVTAKEGKGAKKNNTRHS